MKHSCGAILYSFHPASGDLGVILGLEGWHWLPFKGGPNNSNETFKEAAIREICEETCGLVKINDIQLEHEFSSKNKHYHIGLVEVDYNIIDKFPELRDNVTEKAFMEKKKLSFFTLKELKNNMTDIHSITKASIDFYWDKLVAISNGKKIIGSRSRNHASYDMGHGSDNYNNFVGGYQGNRQGSANSNYQGNYQSNYQSNKYKKYNNFPSSYSSNKYNSSFLRKPPRFGLSYTPMREKMNDLNKKWR